MMNFPILSLIIFLPLLGSFFVFFSRSKNDIGAIYISILTTFVNLLLCIFLWWSFENNFQGFQFVEEKKWISGYIKFKLDLRSIWSSPYLHGVLTCSHAFTSMMVLHW